MPPSTHPTMRAVLQPRYGSADALEVGEVPVPVPGADELLVRVHAAGLDRGVWHLMAGRPYLVRVMGFGLTRPKQPVPGSDVAGVVEAVGERVTRFRPGDEIYGVGRGTFAELALVPEAKAAPKPASIGFEDAAAVPISATTALHALREQGGMRPGQRVLVVGASGGVGGYAVQIAVALGGRVTGVASAGKADFVRSLGAEEVIDYRTEEVDERGPRYDLVVDIGGNRPLRCLRRALTPEGTLVIVGGESGGRLVGGTDRQLRAMLWSPLVSQRLTTFIAPERAEDLEELSRLIEAGELVPRVERSYPLAEAADAVRQLEAGEVRGKVVITP